MSKISELYQQILTIKINEILEKSDKVEEISEEANLSGDEIMRLNELLAKSGLKRGEDFIFEYGTYDDYYGKQPLSLVINNEGVIIAFHELDGTITSKDEETASYLSKYDTLKEIKVIDIIEGRETEKIIETEEEIDFKYLAYDLYSHEVINTKDKDIDIDIDYVSIADLDTVIYNILRNTIIDTKSNEMYNETGNYCEIGDYSDMPGEEEIAIILNSIDRKILTEYFKKYPEDIKLFEQMKEKYPDIEGINEEIQQPKDARKLFEDSLLRDDVVEYYLSKTPEELEEELGPEVARMVGFEQKNSHHCYDLWEHTLRTVEGISPEGLTPEEVKKLRVAAFFHDIGKPDVSKFNEKTGQQVFYGHAMHSVEVAKPVLEQLGYSSDEIEQLSFYIGHHDDFISYKSKTAPWMKNHEFMRGIDSDTVSEKIIENQYNFKAMGYDDDQIRYICYALGHDGQEPTFATKDGPIDIKVDMAEVQVKIDSGKYDVSYIPSEEDYKLLLELCKADAGAQSEVAMQQGRVVGSKKEKLENMNNIQNSIPEAFKSVIEKVTGYSFEQFIKDSVPQAYGEKRPPLICKDGTEYSIQASSFHACLPKKDGLEAYDEFEVYVMSDVEDFAEFINYDGVAGNVPKEVIEGIIKAHGGLDKKVMRERVQAQKDVFKPKDEAYEKWLEEASNGNPFVAQMLRYATRRVEVRGQDEQAKKLEEQYGEQLPKDQHIVDDNE